MQDGAKNNEAKEAQSPYNAVVKVPENKPTEKKAEPQAEPENAPKEEPSNKLIINNRKFGGKKSPATKQTKLPSCSLPNNMQPTFYVGGGNGVALVESAMLGMGWKRTMDKYDERFRLKWVECKTRINYNGFKEGEQLVNHIPNGNLLTNKLGLLNSLQEYERVTLSTKGRPPRLRFTDFVPETYRLDEAKDKEEFLKTYSEGELWICKPTGMNQGKGIFIIRSMEEITKLLEEREQRKEQMSRAVKPLMTRVVQRYITNPLLLDGRKFDIRAYMLIASTVPFLVLYHKGYVRLCCNKYNEDARDLMTHLTNQFVQKKDPSYKDVKEDTAWSMDKFNTYINEKVAPGKNLEEDWVYNTFTKQMQKIMIHCFNSVKHKLQSRIGFFDLYGLDFMVDTDMKVWLIEVNVNPALHVNCAALKEVIPTVVEETLHICVECFEKSRRHQSLLPLNSLKGFSVLYCGTRANCITSRQTRSVSPVKEIHERQRQTVATASVNSSSQRTPHKMTITSTPVVSSSNTVTTASGTAKKTETTSVASNKATEQPSQQDDSNVKLKMTHGETNASKSSSDNSNENQKSTSNETPKSAANDNSTTASNDTAKSSLNDIVKSASNNTNKSAGTKSEDGQPLKTVTKAAQAESIARLTAGKSSVEKSESKTDPKKGVTNQKPTSVYDSRTPLKATDFKLVLNMSMKSQDSAASSAKTSPPSGSSAKAQHSTKTLPLLSLTTSSCANILNNPSQLINTLAMACSNTELGKRASLVSSATYATNPMATGSKSVMATDTISSTGQAQSGLAQNTVTLPGIKGGGPLVGQSTDGITKLYTEPASVTFTSWDEKDQLITSITTVSQTSVVTRSSLIGNSARSNTSLTLGSARHRDRDRPDRGN